VRCVAAKLKLVVMIRFINSVFIETIMLDAACEFKMKNILLEKDFLNMFVGDEKRTYSVH
jgi:hypothetical protein